MVNAQLVRISPRRSLLTTGFVSIIAAMVPVFGVLYWFAIPTGTWVTVFVVHVLVILASVAILFRQLTVYCAVTPTELIGNGIFSRMVRVPLDRIASVIFVQTYVGQAPEPVTQLLVRDSAGRPLFRMRGSFWHSADLYELADALPVIPVRVSEPMSIEEFFRAYPGSAYWFENRPILRLVAIAAAVAAIIAVAGLVMTMLGMHNGVFG